MTLLTVSNVNILKDICVKLKVIKHSQYFMLNIELRIVSLLLDDHHELLFLVSYIVI